MAVIGAIISSCTKSHPGSTTTTTTVNCPNPGTFVNIGSNAEKGFTQTTIMNVPGCEICVTSSGTHNDAIGFDNTKLNFSISDNWNSCGCAGAVPGIIWDNGPANCPNFAYSGTHANQVVAYVQGHGYVGIFADGHVIKFTTGGITNGTVQIDYIWQ